MTKSHEFEWDAHNQKHLARHGISRADAEDVLLGNHVLVEYQMEGDEVRWIAVGRNSCGPNFEYYFRDSRRGSASDYRLGRRQGNGRYLHQRVGALTNMAKAKMKPTSVPRFSSEADEAAWWDSHRSEIEAEIRRRMKQKKPLILADVLLERKATQPITLRIPTEDLETARLLAARKGLGYQTYIKMLLRGALAKDLAKEV